VARTVFLDEPPYDIAAWLERRRALGQDLYDEVWEGEYHVAPAPHRRHGYVGAQLAVLLWPRARQAGLWLNDPLNIGEPDNYRVPDRAILRDREMSAFLPTAAVVVEVVSPGDESYQKFDFYFARWVEEVLIVDPQRRTVEWYARGADAFTRSGRSTLLDVDEPTLHGEIDWPPT
jgi:Uma2 family endonuclease